MDAFLRLVGKDPHGEQCARDECERQKEEHTDRRLNEQIERLRVLELEAYGNRRKRRDDH